MPRIVLCRWGPVYTWEYLFTTIRRTTLSGETPACIQFATGDRPPQSREFSGQSWITEIPQCKGLAVASDFRICAEISAAPTPPSSLNENIPRKGWERILRTLANLMLPQVFGALCTWRR